MTKLNINSKKGFTIIEVVLVLAIAGLIFLMVFVALPNLQRTQRDTQRRNDLDRLSTSLSQYIVNNNRLPDSGAAESAFLVDTGSLEDLAVMDKWQTFAYNYLLAGGQDTFVDPNGDAYILEVVDGSANTNPDDLKNAFSSLTVDSVTNTGVMVVGANAKCGDEVEVVPFEAASGSRRYAVAMRLEGNGIYCVDNN